MKVGRYEVTVHNHGFFRLDGGSMFGSVPKPLWEKEASPDEENRILLATRSLIIEDGERKVLVDVGCGDKWSEKGRAIFCISPDPYVPVSEVTDVFLTHFHFDHAGGISRFRPWSQEIEPCYPNARHYVSAENLENAIKPNAREKASYLHENVSALNLVRHELTQDGQEILPGLSVHQSDGHTRGLHWVKLTSEGITIVFPADLCPTSKHLPLPFLMGYDMCAETALREKEDFLKQAVEESWIVVFEHDPTVAAARLNFDDRGRARIGEELRL